MAKNALILKESGKYGEDTFATPADLLPRCNVQALTADLTLTAQSAPIQIYTITASRLVYLPTANVSTGQSFTVLNLTAYDKNFSIQIYQGATKIAHVNSQGKTVFIWDGSNWQTDNQQNIQIGQYANATGRGTAMGYNAGATNYGYAAGYNATANDGGVGIGSGTNGSSYGIAIGPSCTGQSYGVAIGNSAIGSNYATTIGAYATSSNGTNTVILGSYSKSARNREIVSTATANMVNKSQFAIQKFKEINLSSDSAAWKEVYIDGSSARLVLTANSIYTFYLQLNAIDITTNDCKSWEIRGSIKRTSSTTALVGNPTITVLGTDTAATNWDTRISADTTNNSLKVEVKHDSTNNVRYSLNLIATETRV